MATPRKLEVEVIVPEGLKAGDTFILEVEIPAPEKKPRGQLAGIALADMTDEQLKREIINAGSVLYKAKDRGADEKTIAANQARLDAAKAEKASRAPAPVIEAQETPNVENAVVATDTDSGTAAEL